MSEPELLEETRMRSPWPSIFAVLGIIVAASVAWWAACQPTTP